MGPIRGVLEASPDAVLVVDEDGVIQHANRHVETVLGYTPAQLEGTPSESLVREPDRERHVRVRDEYLESPEPRPMGEGFELYAVDADGRELPVEVSLGPVEQDGDLFVVTTIVDVSDRRERERELERTADILRHTQRIAGVGGWELDVSESPYEARWTDQLFEIFEIEPRESLTVEEVLTFVHPEDRPRVRAETEFLIEERVGLTQEYRIRTGEGTLRWLRVISESPADRDDILRGATYDVTDRKRRERDLERQNERLEQFASLVSHDLRNPLAVAEGHLELAREACDSEHLENVGAAHDRMRALIDDLLALAQEGETAVEPEPVVLADVVEECWRNVATADASLVVETDRTVRADAGQLKQLLENLFRNAVEHSATDPASQARRDAVEHGSTGGQDPERSGDAASAGPDVTVTVGDLQEGDGFYVADDGPGIPPGERDRVFEAGYSTGDDGTGVGLAIVDRIAEVAGWTVRVTESAEGGARFEFVVEGDDAGYDPST